MFTGIIETKGTVDDIISSGTNKTFWIASSISGELKVDQSISHDGVCLTIEEVKNGRHRVTAIEETLVKTNLKSLSPNSMVNLERCLRLNDRLDGHIVQGHVDTTAECTGVTDKNGSWEYSFLFEKRFTHLVIEKGSVAINGTSFTIFNLGAQNFSIAVIPYTYFNTNIQQLRVGDKVNIEFDMMGKYVSRILEQADNFISI